MKYILWLFYSFTIIGIAYMLPLLLVGEKVEVRKDYFKSFEASEIRDINEIHEEEEVLKLALVGVEVLQGSNGRKDWQLNAEWLTYSGGSGDLFAHEPELVYSNRSKRQEFKATGDNAKVIEKHTKVELEGNVQLRQDSIRLTAPSLEFDTQKEIFNLTNNVQVRTPELLGRANRMSWDTDGNNIRAQGRAVFILNHNNSAYSLNSAVRKAPTPLNKDK